MLHLIKYSLILLLVLLAIPHKALALDSPAKAGASQRLKTIIVDNYHPYTADVIAHLGVLDNGVYFIQKPFSLPNMAVKVREVLDAA